jgi:excinuclease ABC subunit C
MEKSRLKKKILLLPKSPGVYVFYGAKREILYVGKATSLKDRVRSYFSLPSVPSGHLTSGRGGGFFERPVDYAISQIVDVKIIKTETVLEAFILEQNLIKKLQPKYNAMGKDDKSFCYVMLTKEDFPRFIIMRKTDLETKHVIASEAKQSQKGLPRRYAPRNDIGIGKIFGPYTSRKQIEIVLKLLKRIFPYHSLAQKTEKGCLDFELGRCPGPYAGAITHVDYLKNIRGIRMILEGKKKGLVNKMEKEMKDFSKAHEYEKAAEARNKLFALKHINDVALISSTSQSPVFPFPDKSGNFSRPKRRSVAMAGAAKPSFSRAEKFRIEAYDISNISGQHSVGSMIVFNNNEPNKAEYRKFKIKTINNSDDVEMMKEVLTRRFHNDWARPNLILLDGGIGHLHMAERLLNSMGLKIPLVAVAKGKDRKGLDFRFRNKDLGSYVSILLRNKILIKQIMDEAHRFAIAYHRKIRKKNFL